MNSAMMHHRHHYSHLSRLRPPMSLQHTTNRLDFTHKKSCLLASHLRSPAKKVTTIHGCRKLLAVAPGRQKLFRRRGRQQAPKHSVIASVVAGSACCNGKSGAAQTHSNARLHTSNVIAFSHTTKPSFWFATDHRTRRPRKQQRLN